MQKFTLPNHNISSVSKDIKDHQVLKHAPKILMLYGSLREESYSRKLTLEAAKMLERFGAEVKVFDPKGLPVFDHTSRDHPKVQELMEMAIWSEGMVWCSPEVHGNITSVFKNQIDWIPLSIGSIRPTQGRTLAVMQVSGGSQSFNAVNSLRILGRWMRMFTIPNQSSVAMAYKQFNEDGSMKDCSFKDRVVDVMEELFRMTIIMRSHKEWLSTRYSENKDLYKIFEEEPLKECSSSCC